MDDNQQNNGGAPYDSVLAAKLLLALAFNQKMVLNVTKVQKLLYIAYGYYLAVREFPLLSEQPQAWPYGPVFPHARKEIDYSTVYSVEAPELAPLVSDAFMMDLFNQVIDRYGVYAVSTLTDWSHAKGSPWEKTTLQPGFNWGHTIPDDYIRAYFSALNENHKRLAEASASNE